MPDMSRPVSGAQPVPDPTALSNPPGPAGRVPDRRRQPVSAPQKVEIDTETSNERTFLELRRKVQASELLSSSSERLLWKIRFNGHLTVVVQNGRVIKTGYEEGYFRRKNDLGGILFET